MANPTKEAFGILVGVRSENSGRVRQITNFAAASAAALIRPRFLFAELAVAPQSYVERKNSPIKAMQCGNNCCQFQPATVLIIKSGASQSPSGTSQGVALGSQYQTTLDGDDMPSRQQILQGIVNLQPGETLSDAFRNLRPSSQGCPRRIVGPINATVEETCPQAVQVPSLETYQTVVNRPMQRLAFQPVQRVEYRPYLQQYIQQVPALGQRQVMRTYLQNVTQQYRQQF